MKKGWKLALSLTVTVLWLWFIYSRSLQNAEASDAESGALLGLLEQFLPFLDMYLVRKLAHFTEYFILGSLLFLDWRLLGRGSLWLPLAAGLLFAASDELLQTRVPGRSGQLSDVLLDFCGAALAVCLLYLFNHIRKNHKKNHRRKAHG